MDAPQVPLVFRKELEHATYYAKHTYQEFYILFGLTFTTYVVFWTMVSAWLVEAKSYLSFPTLSECLARDPPVFALYISFYVLLCFTMFLLFKIAYLNDFGPIYEPELKKKYPDYEMQYQRRFQIYGVATAFYLITQVYVLAGLLTLLIYDTESNNTAHRLFAAFAFICLVVRSAMLFLRRIYVTFEPIRKTAHLAMLIANVLVIVAAVTTMVVFVVLGTPELECAFVCVISLDWIFQVYDYYKSLEYENELDNPSANDYKST